MTPPDRDDPRSDDLLVEAVNRGDVEAFEALYRRYRDWVVDLAFRFTRNREDALDVLQDAFAYFLGKFPGFRLEAKLTTFLYPTVKHLAIRARQKTARFAPIGTDPPVEARAEPAAGLEGSREELESALEGIPEGAREALLLRFVDGLTLEEIAAAQGVPLGTVKSRIHNALKALRDDPRTRRYFGA